MPTKVAKKTVRKTPAKKTVTRKKAVAVGPVAVKPKAVGPIKRTYLFAVGRRKEAVARVRWYQQETGELMVNQRPLTKYFPLLETQQLITAPLKISNLLNHGKISAKVNGGGTQGQADAIRLGLARVLVKSDPELRLPLKRAGFLRRDPRVKERKKYGLKRARRAPQWQKR